MTQTLPNFDDPVIQAYGIPEIYDAMPELFEPRSIKPIVGIVDQGGSSHESIVIKHLIQPIPEVVGVRKYPAGTDGNITIWEILGGVEMAMFDADNMIGINTSIGVNDSSGMGFHLAEMTKRELYWFCPANYYPAKHGGECVISTGAMKLDGTPISNGHDSTMFYAYASAVSYASPQPGSVMAMLKCVDPSLSFADLRQLLIDGAIMLSTLEGKCQYGIINHKRSLEKLLGRSIGASTVLAPQPITEPKLDQPQYREDKPHSFAHHGDWLSNRVKFEQKKAI